MKFKLSVHAKEVMLTRNISRDWVSDALSNPSGKLEISEHETHYFFTIREYGNRCLKVVINPIKLLVITAYFDRKAHKRGCK